MTITVSGSTLTFSDSTTMSTAATGVNAQVFTSSGTWTKPAGATTVFVQAWGAGAGGTAGAKKTNCYDPGGPGGGGGGYNSIYYRASDLGSTVSVIVGAYGTGGAGTSVSGPGAQGSSGGASSFGNFKVSGGQKGATANNMCARQPGGYGGAPVGDISSCVYFGCITRMPERCNTAMYGRSSSTCPFPLSSYFGGGAGGSSSYYGGICCTFPGGASVYGGGGGGAGGSILGTNRGCTSGKGSRGGASNNGLNTYLCGTAGGTAGENGGNASYARGGGGGGGSNFSGTGGTGGTGGTPAGGGGGGGASRNGTGGNGGNGGAGLVIVYSW